MLTSTQITRVQRLWNELSQFKAADSDAALEYFLHRLVGMLRAQDAMWVGAVRLQHGAAARRDVQFGWRGRAIKHLHPNASRLALSRAAVKQQDTPQAAPTTVAVVAQAGKFRGARLRELVDMAAFRQTRHYQNYYTALSIRDRMWISFPVNGDAESHFIFDRTGAHRPFRAADLELARFALQGVRWFHCQVMLSHGLMLARKPLSPVQRQVLTLLLTDASEKSIASQLGQSFHTTHTHVRDIFRCFGVTSRSGLMAIWLSVA
jgi:DNA-binding CsgD family transcriptional regulator